jgi:hypothetical protein
VPGNGGKKSVARQSKDFWVSDKCRRLENCRYMIQPKKSIREKASIPMKKASLAKKKRNHKHLQDEVTLSR